MVHEAGTTIRAYPKEGLQSLSTGAPATELISVGRNTLQAAW